MSEIFWERVLAKDLKVGDQIRFLDIREPRRIEKITRSRKGIRIRAERQPGDPVPPVFICSRNFKMLRVREPNEENGRTRL